MSFRLKRAVFKVRCRQAGCPFAVEVPVKENIMGATEADVDSEAWKVARSVAYSQHDAIHGNSHALADPDIHKLSGTYERLGPAPAARPKARQSRKSKPR